MVSRFCQLQIILENYSMAVEVYGIPKTKICVF